MHLDYTYTFVLMCDRSNAVHFNTHRELDMICQVCCAYLLDVYSVLLAALAAIHKTYHVQMRNIGICLHLHQQGQKPLLQDLVLYTVI